MRKSFRIVREKCLRTHDAMLNAHFAFRIILRSQESCVRTFEPMAAAARAVQLARAGQPVSFDDGPVGDIERDALAEGLSLWLKAKAGTLYLAANASWPGLYKIGCTRRSVDARMRQLNGPGMPTPWVVYQTWPTYDAHGLEALAHRACRRWQAPLSDKLNSELFDASAEVLIACINRVLADDNRSIRNALAGYFSLKCCPAFQV